MKKGNSLTRVSQITGLIGFIFTLMFGCYYKLCVRTTDSLVEQNERAFIDKRFGNFLVPDTDTLILSQKIPLLKILPGDTTRISNLIEDIYARRLSQYETFTGKMNRILDVLLVMLVVSLFILFYQPTEVEVPIVKFILPDKLFYVIVPLAIVYLYFQLGLTLNAAIDSRLVLETMTDNMEIIGSERVSYYHSNARTLVDQGLIDSWCTWHYNIFKGGRMQSLHEKNAFGILFFWFGTFLGLILATCQILISVYYEKYNNRILSIILNIAANWGFLIWSLSLIAWYQHSAFLVSWMWGVSLLSIFFWNNYGKKFAEQLTKKKHPHGW
jgi:hypothetical protein